MPNIFKNATTKTKQWLWTGFVITLTSIIAAFAVNAVSLQRLDNSIDVVDHHMKTMSDLTLIRVDLAARMYAAARERSVLLIYMAQTTDEFERDDFNQEFSAIGSEYAEARLKLIELGLSEEEKTLLDFVDSIARKNVPLQRQASDLLMEFEEESTQEALEILLSKIIPFQQEVVNKLRKLRQLQLAAATDIVGQSKQNTHDAEEEMHLTQKVQMVSSTGTIAVIIIAFFIMIRRITNVEDALYDEKELAQVTLTSMGEALIVTNLDGSVRQVNFVAEELLKVNELSLIGRPLYEVLNIEDENGDNICMKDRSMCRDGKIIQLNNITLNIDETTSHSVEMTCAPITDKRDGVIGSVLIIRDVSEARKLSQQLSYKATHDDLTGLINRTEFERRINSALRESKLNRSQHAVLFLDLDQFKVVNDTCGHVAGDKLLRELSHLLQKRVRDADTLARLGGDEFGILLKSCPITYAQEVANDIRQLVQDYRFSWEGNSFVVTSSIGIVAVTDMCEDVQSILSSADTAMYAAKDKGRNRIYTFELDNEDTAQRHGEMQWVTKITQAFEEDRFQLYYQSIIPISDRNKLVHHETLIRMINENGEVVPPMAFIPAAERYNLMPTMDRWVVRKLFSILSESINTGSIKPFSIFTVNLSGASLNDEDFANFLKEQFVHYDIPPELICFEITETAAIANLVNASSFINDIKQLGCSFALDDFGSGLSSFAYLKTLPVDILKIDGGFVKDILTDHVDLAMVESINQVGHKMGIETIAEFVESDEIFYKLRELDVDYAQGYGISVPRPFIVDNITGMYDESYKILERLHENEEEQRSSEYTI